MATVSEKIMARVGNKDERLGYAMALGIGLVLVLLFVYSLSEKMKKKKKKKMPPGPYPWPVFGNLFLGGAHPHQVFTLLAKRYSNIMSLFFGSVRVVVVSDASMAKELFSVNDLDFASRPIHDFMHTPAMYMNYGEENTSMAISEYTPRVRELRQLCNSELFTAQKLDMKKGTRAEEIQRTVAALAERSTSPVEIRPILSEFSLRVNCRFTFNQAFLHSESLPAGGSGLDPDAFRKLETENTKLLASHNILDLIPALQVLLGRFDMEGLHARWKDVTRRKVSCADSVLNWYRKDSGTGDEESETDFAETMLRLSDDGKYTVTSARAILFGAVDSGHGHHCCRIGMGSAAACAFPQCMAKLQAEMDAQFGMAGPVDEGEALELPYLQAVVKEVLRLHNPTTMGLPHSNMADATLGGYHIPARTTVLANFWALHRDPATWGDDALTFNPDRFLTSDFSVTGTNQYQYIPFGAGRRICPGRGMAMRVLSVALGSFVHALDLSAPPGVTLTDNEGTNGLNIRPETPLRLHVNLRPAASLYLTPTTATPDA